MGSRPTAIIEQFDFSFELLSGPERDEAILEAVRMLQADLSVAGPARRARWEEGWAENLEWLRQTGFDLRELKPGYYRRGAGIMRLEGQYIRPASADFETNFLAVLLAWLADTYLADAPHIFEFGCGPGHNLVALAEHLPQTRFVGLDWADSSQRILAEVAASTGMQVEGRKFNFFEPDAALQLPARAALLTIGALEQVGTNIQPFLDFCLEQRPRICVHIEPILELYDRQMLLDYLAAEYHRRRGYLEGWLSQLRDLESRGAIEILHVKRNLGSHFHDGWSTIVWQIRP